MLYIYDHKYAYIFYKVQLRGVVANVLDCNLLESELENHFCY